MIFWVKITQLPMTYLIYLLIFFMLSRILCMIVPISKIGCSLSGMFQNLTLPWTILSIVASYRELCQHFLILALRNTWVSTIPWYYAEILISLIPSIARKKTYTHTHMEWYFWPQAILNFDSNLLVKCHLCSCLCHHVKNEEALNCSMLI